MWACERWLGARRPQPVAELLRIAAAAVDPGTRPDRYGDGDVVEDFEMRMAALLGAEAAMLLPSGTMAQQIALRIHCDRRGRDTVAFHPTCHLALHEHGAYEHLHGLHAELAGDRDRLITLADLQAIAAPIGALLLELPQREIGGQLPEWEDLRAQAQWARDAGAAVHLDGARIWEAAPYYGRSPAEVAGVFDTVYASLYKGLGAFAGSVLAGPLDVIAEARIWRARHGGTLAGLFPFVASALRGLEELAPRMGEFLGHARAITEALADVDGVTVVPRVAQTPLFHLHLRGEPEALWERVLEVARSRRVWLFNGLRPTVVPGVSRTEISIGAPATEISAGEAAELIAAVVAER